MNHKLIPLNYYEKKLPFRLKLLVDNFGHYHFIQTNHALYQKKMTKRGYKLFFMLYSPSEHGKFDSKLWAQTPIGSVVF